MKKKTYSVEEQFEIVRRNPYSIMHIKNPYSIMHIKNPCKEDQLEAVRQNGILIKWIENPYLEVQLEACKQCGYAIKFINNPSVEVQLLACKQCGDAIRFINNPSEEVKSLIYGELTNIVLKEEVCKICGESGCKYFENGYIRSKCDYLVEHKIYTN